MEARCGEPAQEFGENFVIVTVPFEKKVTGKNAGTEQIFPEILKPNPSITQAELAKQLGLSVCGVKKYLTKLKERGVLRRVVGQNRTLGDN